MVFQIASWSPISPTPSLASKIPLVTLFRCIVLVLLFCAAGNARADLNPKQARKSITRMPGFELTNGSVRVKSVTLLAPNTAEATAEIKTVFKLQKSPQGEWAVVEIRTRPDIWEEIDFIALALNAPVATGACNVVDPPFKSSSSVQPSVKRVRCLVGNLLGIDVPSDAVRIQEVTPLEIPLSNQPSAVAVAWIRADARLVNGAKGWQVTELRTGNRDWAKLDDVIAAINARKTIQARTELTAIAKALGAFRLERGAYVVSEDHAVAIDHLSPRFLPVVIRVDPWHQPYKYLGDRDHFTVRSIGADAKENTLDDILISQ